MQINSPAGEFGFEIEGLAVEGDKLVMTGRMGVWEAETVVTQADFARIVGELVFKARFWRFLLGVMFRRKQGDAP